MRLFEGTPFDIPPKCDLCGMLESDCTCTAAMKSRIDPAKQTAILKVEKRKKGKVVTTITGLSSVANDLPALLKIFKNSCGAGGTLEGDSIVIQGNHSDAIKALLKEKGYKTKP